MAVIATYDPGGDVLYVTFDGRPAGRGFEVLKTVVMRCSEDGKEVYGLTILDAKELPSWRQQNELMGK